MIPQEATVIALHQAITHAGREPFGPFSFSAKAGEHIAVLGPSGSGKSTLLNLISANGSLDGGTVYLQQRPLADWSLVDLSRIRAVLPQQYEIAFALPAHLVIALGRVSWTVDPQQSTIVAEAAHLAQATHLLGRRFDTLSGGEKARIHLARVFAQLWDSYNGLLLLDEPAAALDPGLQIGLLEAVFHFANQRAHTIIAILHDINHALQWFERFLLVKEGQSFAFMEKTATLIDTLEALYHIQLYQLTTDKGDTLVFPRRQPLP